MEYAPDDQGSISGKGIRIFFFAITGYQKLSPGERRPEWDPSNAMVIINVLPPCPLYTLMTS
jgi:hypothetical protein